MDKSRLRVVIIGPTSERYKGGIAQFTRYLAGKLADACEVSFFSWYQLYPMFLISRDFRDSVSRTTTGNMKADFILGYLNPFSWLRCARAIRALQPDKVFLTWSHFVHAPVYLFLNYYLKHFTNAEVIYICHNVMPHEQVPGAKLLTRLSLQGADLLAVHGRSEAAQARALVHNAKVVTLFLPLFNFFQGTATRISPKKAKQFLYFGNIRPYKGLDILLQAFSRVLKTHPEVRLRIVGEGFYKKRFSGNQCSSSDEDAVSELIKALALEDVVTTDFRYVPNEEVPSLFSNVDAAVFPYRDATQSGTIAVAYSYGVPVISTRVGAIPDVVIEGKSGYLAAPNDPDSFAEAIEQFLATPLTASDVSQVAAMLSWERYVEGVLTGKDFSLLKMM